MKRVHTSRLLFLGVWLAILLAGYMASRASIFAATGSNSCDPCQDCEEMNTYWESSDNTTGGYGVGSRIRLAC